MVGCGEGTTPGDGGTGGGSSKTGGGTGTTGGGSGTTGGGSGTTGGGSGTTGGGSGTTGGGTGTGGGATTGDIVAVASGNPDFSILVQAVTKAGLGSALQAATPKKTVFAPTNAAFAALLTELGAASLDDLTADQLKPILLYHVLGSEVRAAAATTAATNNSKVDSLGGKIQLSLQGTSIRIDARATITATDINASNGVIHRIDKVLLPSIADIATTTPAVSSLVAALQLADTGNPSPNLVTTLDNDASATKFTVFAPTNDGFTALVNALKGNDNGAASGITALTSFRPDQVLPVLRYHVAPARYLSSAVPTAATKIDTLGGKALVQRTGAAVTVDGVSVVTANLLASNGVIHVIGSVLLPSIADIATTTPAVSNLVAALALADTGNPSPNLVTTLDNDASATKFTVFAPTNAAFTALVTALGPAGVTALTDFRPDNVLPVLTYHVAGASYFAAQVPTAATAIDTLGGKVTVQRTGNAVTVDGVSVAAANLFASNGVIHVIGSVLVPSITDVVTTSARFSSLKAAVLAADGAATTTPKVAAALDGTANFTLFAPSNTAFTNLGTAPTGQALTNVLLYHAVPGNPVYAAAALALTAPLVAPTALTGKTVSVNAEGTAPNKTVTVADSTATKANVNAVNFFTSNGVIHQVDKVLIPSP